MSTNKRKSHTRKRHRNPASRNIDFAKQMQAEGKPCPLFNGDWDKFWGSARLIYGIKEVLFGAMQIAGIDPQKLGQVLDANMERAKKIKEGDPEATQEWIDSLRGEDDGQNKATEGLAEGQQKTHPVYDPWGTSKGYVKPN